MERSCRQRSAAATHQPVWSTTLRDVAVDVHEKMPERQVLPRLVTRSEDEAEVGLVVAAADQWKATRRKPQMALLGELMLASLRLHRLPASRSVAVAGGGRVEVDVDVDLVVADLATKQKAKKFLAPL